jgi:hypothetical protein
MGTSASEDMVVIGPANAAPASASKKKSFMMK